MTDAAAGAILLIICLILVFKCLPRLVGCLAASIRILIGLLALGVLISFVIFVCCS